MQGSDGGGRGPKYVLCYICNRKYGTHSFDIHLKQCKELYVTREMQKPPGERRPMPKDPRDDESFQRKATSMTQEELEEMNRRAEESALVPCQWCGRTFMPDKLPIHNRSCTRDNPAKSRKTALAQTARAVGAFQASAHNRPMTTGGGRQAGGSEQWGGGREQESGRSPAALPSTPSADVRPRTVASNSRDSSTGRGGRKESAGNGFGVSAPQLNTSTDSQIERRVSFSRTNGNGNSGDHDSSSQGSMRQNKGILKSTAGSLASTGSSFASTGRLPDILHHDSEDDYSPAPKTPLFSPRALLGREAGDKTEIIRSLTKRISELEAAVFAMQSTISDIKVEIASLQE